MKKQLICPMCDGNDVVGDFNKKYKCIIYHCVDCGCKGYKSVFIDHIKEIEKDRLLEGEQF